MRGPGRTAATSVAWWFVFASVVLLAAAAALPGAAEDTACGLVSLISLVAAAVGIRRWRPAAPGWWALVAGASVFLLGRAVLAAQPVATRETPPFPSPADAFFVVGYVLLFLGAAVLVRQRSAGSEDDSLLDGVIVATAVGVVMAAYFVGPYLRDPDPELLDKALTVVYALFDVVLVAVTVRLAVGWGRRPPSYYLLAAGLTAIILTDGLTTLYQFDNVGKSWVVVSSSLCYVFFAAAALHPSMAQVTERPPLREARLSGRRLALLCAALLLVPGLLTLQIALGEEEGVPVLAAGSVAMALLVLGRLARLVRSKERKAARERVLRQAGVALVAATSRRDIHEAAIEALAALVPPDEHGRVSVAASRDRQLVVVASDGYRSDDAIGTPLRFHPWTDEMARGVPAQGPVSMARATPIDVPVPTSAGVGGGDDEADSGFYVLVVPLRSRGELGGAFVITTPSLLPLEPSLAVETLAGQVSLALESAALTEEIHRRRHERRFKKLVERSTDLITVMGADGLMSFVSPASSELLGVDPETLIGHRLVERVHAEDRAVIAWMSGPVTADIVPSEPVELRLRHANGEWRWFEVVVDDALSEPEVEGLVIHARDITDRKAAELLLAEREARFRSLVQNSSDLVMVVDDESRISYVSPSVTRMLGFSADSLLSTRALDLVHQDDAVPATRSLFGENGHGPRSTTEVRFRTATGSWLHLDVTVSDLRHDPAVAGIVLNARDITERQRSEERWRAFGAEASHQLRTPLTGLRLSIENALGQLGDSSPERHTSLEGALAQVERMEATVEDFIALAPRRLEAIPPLDVAPVVQDMDAAWRSLIEADGRCLAVHVEESLPLVQSSPAAVRQVVGVLIANALKHGAGTITVVAKEVAGGIALEVSDEGELAPASLPQVFGSGPAPAGGHNMGLALARSLAEAEGGRLMVRRTGRSPTFAFFMPGSSSSPPGAP